MARWRIAGINFDHSHMGDNLRMVFEHSDAEIVGICDEQPARMRAACTEFQIPRERVYTDYRRCIEETRPDLVLLCPATARHAEWTCKVAHFGVHILLEKPFASSVAEADAMIAAVKESGKRLAINWPLAWYPSHRTAKRLVEDGVIGAVREVHYYDGNRGPLWHVQDKHETTEDYVQREKPHSWFYRKSAGGGSLLDYLGYGSTLGTWFMNGQSPYEVTTVVDHPRGLEVDEHSITVARYESGLSKFETRWGTFTDPWMHQPQPKCGFVLVGERGTISSYDYEAHVIVQRTGAPEAFAHPVDTLMPPFQNPVQYFVHCLEEHLPIEGPLSPEVARIGQTIVDAAVRSVAERRTVELMRAQSRIVWSQL